MKILKSFAVAASAFAISLAALSAHAASPEIKAVDVTQAQEMKNQGALLIDVREPDEFADGHAPGSTLIPLGQLKSRLNELRGFENKPVVLVCRSGRRSAQAGEILRQTGFNAVYNVQGGMLAWEKAALKVIKGAK